MTTTKEFGRFAAFFAATWALTALLGFGLEFAGMNLSGLVWFTIVPAMAAADDAGGQYYKKHGSLPDSHLSWVASLKMTAVEVAISLPVLVMVQYPTYASEGEVDLVRLILATFGAMVGTYAVSLVAKRFSFASAAKGTRKRAHSGKGKIGEAA